MPAPGSPTVTYSGGDTTVKSIRAIGAGSGDLVVSGGSLTTTGDSRFDGTLRINGGTFVSGGATQVTKLVVDGGTLDGAGDITVTSPAATGSFSWSGGTLQGDGELVLPAGTVSEIKGTALHESSRSVRNVGTLTWSDGDIRLRSDLGGVGAIDNSGAIAITGNDTLSACCSGNVRPSIRNQAGATITKSGAGTATLGQGGNDFTNRGTVTTKDSGTLKVGGGPSSGGSGVFDAEDLSTIDFTEGTFTITGDGPAVGGMLAGIGTVMVSGANVELTGVTRVAALGIVDMRSGSLRLDNTPPAGTENNAFDLFMTGGTFGGSADVSFVDGMQWHGGSLTGAGTLLLDDGTTNTIDTTVPHDLSKKLRNLGTLTWSDGDIRLPRRSRQRCRSTRQRQGVQHHRRRRLDVVLCHQRHHHHPQRGGGDDHEVGSRDRDPRTRRQRLHQPGNGHDQRLGDAQGRWRPELGWKWCLRRRGSLHDRLHRRNVHDHG